MTNILKTLFPACLIYENSMYYVTHLEHAIKKMNLKNGKTHYINEVPDYYPTEWSGVDRLLENNGKIYLFEQNGNRLLEYSIQERKSRCLELKCNINTCDNYAAQTIFNNKIYIFSKYANELTIVELETGKIRKDSFVLLNNEYVFNKEKINYIFNEERIEKAYELFSCGCLIDSEMWIFPGKEQFVIKYDLANETYSYCNLPENIRGCVHATWRNNLVYILSMEGNIYSWNIKNNEVELIWNSHGKNFYPNSYKIVVTDKNIWCLPLFGNDIKIISIDEKNERTYDSYPIDFRYYDKKRSRYYEYCEDEKNYYFAMHSANYILIINKISGGERWFRPIEPNLDEKINYHIKNINQNVEELDYGLEGLYLILKKVNNHVYKDKQKVIGKKVWTMMNL